MVLTTAFERLAPLHRPIMVLALRGLFDIAEVATDAVEALTYDANGDSIATTAAAIDPDSFYDFTQERPQAAFDEDGHRYIEWPSNEFSIVRHPGAAHDLVTLVGVEPHLRYGTYADAIVQVAARLGCEVVVTLGAAPEAVPHTRPAPVVGSSTNVALARALGLSQPRYQGITGLVGVLQERLDRAGIPAVSLRVGVPHYLGNAKHPQASAALLRHLEHVLSVPTGHAELQHEAQRWRTLHDEVVAEDPDAVRYVARLERDHDLRAEASIPSADDLAAEFERFLRGESGEENGDD